MIKTRMLAATAAIGLLGASGAYAQTTPAATTSPAQGAASSTPASAASAGASGSTSTSASAPTLAAGSTVYDQQGGTVGKVESVQGDFAVVATTKNKVKLPKSSFGQGDKGPVLAMTATQLDQAAAQAAPQAAAGGSASASAKPNVAKGAQVADTQGGAVGTVSAVDPQFATVDLTTGGKVRLPVNAFGAGDNGGLRVAMTAQQLSAAAGASGAKSSGGS